MSEAISLCWFPFFPLLLALQIQINAGFLDLFVYLFQMKSNALIAFSFFLSFVLFFFALSSLSPKEVSPSPCCGERRGHL